jgi:hypothetical protein
MLSMTIPLVPPLASKGLKAAVGNVNGAEVGNANDIRHALPPQPVWLPLPVTLRNMRSELVPELISVAGEQDGAARNGGSVTLELIVGSRLCLLLSCDALLAVVLSNV